MPISGLRTLQNEETTHPTATQEDFHIRKDGYQEMPLDLIP